MSDFKVPSGLFARSKELVALASKLGVKEVSYQVSRIAEGNPQLNKIAKQLEQATAVTETLGRLKGAAMKAGQLLSLDTSNLFSSEIRNVLSTLQNQSQHFMSPEQVKQILHAEWGEKKLASLEEFENRPFAAASIGQVHRAKHQGRPLAIKIQYPGVATSVDSDLNLLKKIAEGFLLVTKKSEISLNALFVELKKELHKEVDYQNEAINLKRFATILAPHSAYRIPKVEPMLSTGSVLAMSFENGLPFKEWMATNPTPQSKAFYAEQILNLYCLEFFENAIVQTDPNFANFLFDDDDDGRKLVLLDFGAVREYSSNFVSHYIRLMQTALERDAQACVAQGVSMGFLSSKERTETKLAFYEMLRASMNAFEPRHQPLYFGDANYAERNAETGKRFMQLIEFSPPPYELVFLHRKLSGVFNLLKSMDVTVDLTSYWERVMRSPHAAPRAK